MAYPQSALVGEPATWASNAFLTALQLSAATGDWAVQNVHASLIIRRISFFIKTPVTCGTATPVITVFKRVTTNSTTSQVAIGTLTIPTATAVGKVIFKDLSSIRVSPGHDIAFAITTQGTDSGTATGAGFCSYIAEIDPEYFGNLTNMTAST